MPSKNDRKAKNREFWKDWAIDVLRLINENKFLLATILLAFIPLFWFRPWNTLITGGDFWLPLGTADTFRGMLGSWLPNVSGGQPNNHLVFPWVAFWALLSLFPLSLSTIEKIWFVIIFLVGGISVYFLTVEVFKSKESGWKNFLPPVLYLFNLYIMMTGVVTTTLLAYMFMPLLFLFYLKGMRSRATLVWAIVLALVSMFMTSSMDNPPIYSIPFFLLFLFFLYSLVFRPSAVSWKMNFQFALLYLLFNSWWLYVYLKTMLGLMGQIKQVTGANAIGGSSNLYDLIRLLGSWAFFAGHLGFPYFPFAKSYLDPVLMFLTFIIPALSFAGFFLYVRKSRGLIIFFAFLVLIGLFFSHGRSLDFMGRVNSLVDTILPLFWIYREPYAKFMAWVALGYAILLGGFFSFLENRLKSPVILHLLGLVTVGVILTIAWPLVTGEHYPQKRGVLAPSRVKIPDYWFAVADYFKKEKNDGRLLILPDNPDWNRSGIPYSWGYDSADIGPFLLTVPWIERNNGYYGLPVLADTVSKLAYKSVNENYQSPSNIAGVLSLLNVSHLLQRNDVDLVRVGSLADNYSPQHMKERLNGQKDIYFVKSIGALDVYRLGKNKYLEKIYSPKKIDCISGDVQMLNYPLEFETSEKKVALFSVNGTEKQQEDFNNLFCSQEFVVPVEATKNGQLYVTASHRASFGAYFVSDSADLSWLEDTINWRPDLKIFLGRVYRSGVYGLYYEKRKVVNSRSIIPEISVVNLETRKDVDNLGGESEVASGLEFAGNFKLTPGPYAFKLFDPAFESPLANFSFEEGPWSTSLSKTPLELSQDSYLGSKSLKLGEGSIDAYSPLPKAKITAQPYEISFFYKVKAGPVPAFFVWENNCPKDFPVWTNYDSPNDKNCLTSFVLGAPLSINSDWVEYKMEYTLNRTAEKLGLGFAFLKADGRVYQNYGQTLIDRVFLQPKIYGGGLALRIKTNSRVLAAPQISLKKESSTKYLVGVDSARPPYYLVFSETFSRDWQAVIKDVNGSRTIPQENHFVVNGYANAWYVETPGTYEVKIEYLPERWFRRFVILSLVSISLSLLYIFIWFTRRRKLC